MERDEYSYLGVSPLEHFMMDAISVTGGTCMIDDCQSALFYGGHFHGRVVFSRSSRERKERSGWVSWQDAVVVCQDHLAGVEDLPDSEVTRIRTQHMALVRRALSEMAHPDFRGTTAYAYYPEFRALAEQLQREVGHTESEIASTLQYLAAAVLRLDYEARLVYGEVFDLGSLGPSGSTYVEISIPKLLKARPALDRHFLPGARGLEFQGTGTVSWGGPVSGIVGEPHISVNCPVGYAQAMRAWYQDKLGMSMVDVFSGWSPTYAE